jgi:hypothetical protein
VEDIPKTEMLPTANFVSMDRFNEMIQIEKEFGACLEIEETAVDKSLWMLIFNAMTGTD